MSVETVLIEPLDALYSDRNPQVLRVGLVVPQSGALGIIGPSAVDAALLAAHEINSACGVRDRRLELVLVDAGVPPAEVAAQVRQLADAGAVEVLVGFHTSDVHRAIEAVVTGRVPYIFTPPHEGGRRLPGVVCTGVDPMRQLRESIGWLTRQHRLRRWALIGNDYIWPQATHRAAARLIAEARSSVVYERRVAFGAVREGLDELFAGLRTTGADALLLSLIGRDLVDFNRALRHAGLDRILVRLSGSLEENGLLAYGGDDTGGMYAVMQSFASQTDDRRLGLAERHRALFGPDAPVLDAYAEGLYDGLHLVAALASWNALGPNGLAAAVHRLLDGDPEGTRAAWARSPLGPPRRQVFLARAEGLDFAVLPRRESTSIWK
ncbi:substrate-binding domain-containing protein [Embleya sp. NPDC020630]|uniref:substrate-binding domain-containing protein n=1 Tax=Embleya sp. NPDC020630 TaxID=3363979 RepID=UPI003793F3E7